MTSPDQVADLEQSVAEIAAALFAPRTVNDVLQRVVGEAAATVEGRDLAGLLFLREGKISTAAYSDPEVIELDALQVTAGEGPCLDVAAGGGTIYAIDLADDARWPHFRPQRRRCGVRSVFAVEVSAARSSVLNLYSHLPAAFGATDRAKALLLATLARFALTSAAEREDDLKRQVNSRPRSPPATSSAKPKASSWNASASPPPKPSTPSAAPPSTSNIKLRDVAQHLVDTGDTGDFKPPPQPRRW